MNEERDTAAELNGREPERATGETGASCKFIPVGDVKAYVVRGETRGYYIHCANKGTARCDNCGCINDNGSLEGCRHTFGRHFIEQSGTPLCKR